MRQLFCAVGLSGMAMVGVSPMLAQAAPENLPSYQSFTGLGFIPNAQVIDTGDFLFSFSQGVPYRNRIAALDDWYFGAGVFEGMEAGGRIVTETYDCNIYFEPNCGIRDLSASFKYQLPFIHDYTGFNVAVGIQDVGGAASNFDASYIVADKTFDAWDLRFSAGYGQSDLSMGILDGPFGGVEWQLMPFLQLAGEYDASEFNATAKVFTPEGWLPYDIQASAHVELYSGHENSDQHLWGVNAAIPLLGFNANNRQRLNEPAMVSIEQQLALQLAGSQSASFNSLAHSLKNEGFINVRVGEQQGELVIALENRRYNRNQVDGLGVALGLIASHANSELLSDRVDGHIPNERVNVLLLNNGIPMLRASTSLSCYQGFLQTGDECGDLQFSTLGLNAYQEQTQWLHRTLNKGMGRSQLIFSPVMNYNLATEYGFFDYSVGLATNLYTPLWQGAAIDVRHTLPLAESDDYEDGRIYANQRLENKVDRALVHQAFRLPWDVMTQFSAGYVYGAYWGGINETQWHSETGRHRLGVQLSEFVPEDDTDDRGRSIDNKGTRLAHYTYSKPEWRWQVKLQGGEYWQGDQGGDITSSHWFGDTRLFARYLYSESEEFLTLGISLPITPWRDMSPGWIQARGVDEYELVLQTRINDSHNQLNTGLGNALAMQHGLDRQYFNRERLSPAYFATQQQRLRNAYLRYIKTVSQ